MRDIILNDELKLSLPDGFRVMDEAERGRLHMLAEGGGICVSDPDRHILISAGWKQAGMLAGMLVNERDLAKNMETSVSRALAQSGYRGEEAVRKTIGGLEASGFRYTYTAEGICMAGESLAFKSGKTLYYIHLYAREESREASLKIWDEILASASRV